MITHLGAGKWDRVEATALLVRRTNPVSAGGPGRCDRGGGHGTPLAGSIAAGLSLQWTSSAGILFLFLFYPQCLGLSKFLLNEFKDCPRAAELKLGRQKLAM